MAIYTPTTSDAITSKKWVASRDLLVESIRETYAFRFMGKDDNALIKVMDNLQKGKGDTINYQLRMKLTSTGVTEGQALVGNEEKLTYYNDSIAVNELYNAVRVPGEGTIYTQRQELEQYEDAKPALKTWLAETIDNWMFNHLCAQNFTTQLDSKLVGFNTPTAIDTNHKLVISGSDESALSSSNPLTLTFIDKMLVKARTISNPIRPIRIDGDEFFVLFIHDNQAYDLETATSGNTWFAIQQNLIQGGYRERSGIFTGASGVYKNVIIHKTNRIKYGIQSSTATTNSYRAVLCGAGALTFALGNAMPGSVSEERLPMRVEEEMFDYGREVGVACNLVGGMKAAVFNSTYYGSLIGVTGYTSI